MRGSKEYIQFLRIAFGSCSELETQLSLAVDLGFLLGKDKDLSLGLVDDVSRLLTNLIKSLKR